MQRMLIKDVMTPWVIWINQNDSLQSAAKKMADCDVGSLPAVDENNNLVGILTDRDIVVRACSQNMDLARTPVSQIMSRSVLTCTPDTPIEDACNLMAERQIRRMPVVDQAGKLIGFVSLANLALNLQAQPQIVENMLAKIASPGEPKCKAA